MSNTTQTTKRLVEVRFCAEVWNALQDDHVDLRKEAIILRAYRLATQSLSTDLDKAQHRLNAVKRHIPMDYLQRHDAAGATGPTSALNLEAAMRDYAEDRWKLIDRLKEAQQRIAELEEENGRLREIVSRIPISAMVGRMGWKSYKEAMNGLLNALNQSKESDHD